MRSPLLVRFLADKIGLDAKDFALGWANGMARWKSWQGPQGPQHAQVRTDWRLPGCPFPEGSVSAAASEAAVAYMRELANARP